jgi:hypothetical protein
LPSPKVYTHFAILGLPSVRFWCAGPLLPALLSRRPGCCRQAVRCSVRAERPCLLLRAERKNGLGYARGSSARRVAPAIHAIPFISRSGRRLRSLRSGRRSEATAFPGFREPGAGAVRWRLSPTARTRQPSADTTRSLASADIASVDPRRSVQNRSTGPANSNRHKQVKSSNLALDSL